MFPSVKIQFNKPPNLPLIRSTSPSRQTPYLNQSWVTPPWTYQKGVTHIKKVSKTALITRQFITIIDHWSGKRSCSLTKHLWWDAIMYPSKTATAMIRSLGVSHSDRSCVSDRIHCDVSLNITKKVYHMVMDNFVNLLHIILMMISCYFMLRREVS